MQPNACSQIRKHEQESYCFLFVVAMVAALDLMALLFAAATRAVDEERTSCRNRFSLF
jgi:hypothetical protein